MTSLAADIGGTFSRLSWTSTGGTAEQRFSNAEFDSLEAVIDQGLALYGHAGETIDEMVLALPGPVHCDPVVLTNINWRVQRAALQQRYRIRHLTIVNDFQAAALGAIAEPYERLKVLNAATPEEGPLVVAGAGTGLGMAWLPTSGFPACRAPPRAAILTLRRTTRVNWNCIAGSANAMDTSLMSVS